MANVCVNDLFNGKNIFVTGGSGFIGKVLIEKLLRTFDGINTIYILLREKKGRSIEERLKLITDNQLFDKLKKLKPHAIKKIVPINGDAKRLWSSCLYAHISTTYCNTDKQVVEEKIYPPHADWRTTIKMAETLDQHTLDIIAPKYMDPLPNTYTFAKSLAEHVVNDLCKGKIPAVIFRPSVVISTFDDPIPGWIDNFNGPVGLLIAGGIGLLRVTLCDPERKPDYIPVDTLIKMLIVCTKERLLNKDLDDVLVYNAASGGRAICKNGDLVELGRSLTWNAPCSQIIWYPNFSMTSNWYVYYTMHLLFHMLPALFVDGLRKLSGRKPM
ncbi:hypothetical protein NQ317_002932 [Molorchus minor]|uniref:Fatty acyl-CoA reductase n=1 Tax=Molorchus minor TaxID=1323400 RepID=A0ABQ9J7M6_9CUCU|nr:hypothetical protein NQ317_002932 [Molorchus minor]